MKKKTKLYSVISIIILLVFLAFSAILALKFIDKFNGDPRLFKTYLTSFGKINSVLVFIGLQIMQIVFPIIPGELIEVGAGYVFGAFWGLILCEIGVLLASVPIFFLVRVFGQKIVNNIFDYKKMDSLAFLQDEKNLTLIVFVLFFIPGTPKDFFTYFIGLTKMKAGHFILITLFARIPSILTSTIVGANIGNGEIYRAVIIYLITGIVSAIGIVVYRKYLKINQ